MQNNSCNRGIIQKIEIFLGSRISKFLRPTQRYDDFKLISIFVKFKKPSKTVVLIAGVKKPSKTVVLIAGVKKPSKTAVVLIAGVTISGTPCPRHIIVPFGAEAPPGHVAQAWSIPPPSWGLLSQWHRQQTTTPETNGASPARTHSDILKRFYALYDIEWRYFMKKVSKLYYLFNPLLHTVANW